MHHNLPPLDHQNACVAASYIKINTSKIPPNISPENEHRSSNLDQTPKQTIQENHTENPHKSHSSELEKRFSFFEQVGPKGLKHSRHKTPTKPSNILWQTLPTKSNQPTLKTKRTRPVKAPEKIKRYPSPKKQNEGLPDRLVRQIRHGLGLIVTPRAMGSSRFAPWGYSGTHSKIQIYAYAHLTIWLNTYIQIFEYIDIRIFECLNVRILPFAHLTIWLNE